MCSQSLVSIIVVTYNSEATIIETLDSVKNQTYNDIELIISDDCSSDDTILLCREWLDRNQHRFVETKLVTSLENTGISANLNRGVSKSTGYWIKSIAGDDILLDECIEKNVAYMKHHPDFEILFSKCYMFNEKDGRHNIFGTLPTKEGVEFLNLTTEEQVIVLYYAVFVPSPTCFIKRSLCDRFCYDERYPAFEDSPFFIKLAENGVHLNFMDEYTVKYRFADSSSHPSTKLENERLWQSYIKYFYEDTIGKIIDKYPIIYRYKKARIKLSEFRIYVLGNKPSFLNRILSFIYRLLLYKDLSIDQRRAIEIAKQYIANEKK